MARHRHAAQRQRRCRASRRADRFRDHRVGGRYAGRQGRGGSASSSDGSVSVAAAVSINIAFTRSEAWIQDGRAISAGGAVTIKSSANTDAAAGADGTAVASGSDGVGVGAAIAINYVELTNSSTVGNTTITSNGLDIEAVMTSVPTAGGPDVTSTMKATANSGAGSKKTGVAGALALNIVNTQHTDALVPGGANVTAGTGNVTLVAESTEQDTTSATSTAKAGKTGVGASIALNI